MPVGSSGALLLPIALAPIVAVALETAALMVMLRGQSAGRRLSILLFPLSQVVLVVQAVLAGTWYGLGESFLVLAAALGAICAVVNIPLIMLILRAERRDEERALKQAAERQLAYQEEHLERTRRAAEAVDRTRRQWGERFDEIARALDAGDRARAEELIADARRLVLSPERFCDHSAVDALLASKAGECSRLGIDLKHEVELPRSAGIDDVELCALMSNAVDNAMRACAGLPERRRWVRVASWLRAGMLVIDVTNPYDEVSRGEDGPRRSDGSSAGVPGDRRREDAASGALCVPEHGWGLDIMRSIAARHHGTVDCSQADDIWRTQVTLRVGADALAVP